MKNIQDVIDIIRKSHYFSPWENILLGSNTVNAWKNLLLHKEKDDFYDEFAEELYT